MNLALSALQPLAAAHLLDEFACGEASLDEWLKSRALANQLSGASRTLGLLLAHLDFAGARLALVALIMMSCAGFVVQCLIAQRLGFMDRAGIRHPRQH